MDGYAEDNDIELRQKIGVLTPNDNVRLRVVGLMAKGRAGVDQQRRVWCRPDSHCAAPV